MSSVLLSHALLLAADARQMMSQGSSLERALDTVCLHATPEEKAAAKSVTYVATRSYVLCEDLIADLTTRPPSSAVRSLLAVSLAQLIASPDKAYVIVNEAIQAAKIHSDTARASGFINACLRRFCREREELLARYENSEEDVLNAPMWWIDRMSDTLGREKAIDMLMLQNSRPPMTLRVNRRKTTREAWMAAAAEAGVKSSPVGLDGVILEEALPVQNLPGFAEGLVSVQDAGAQLAAQFIAPKKGERILDACSAPGGKTAHLLEYADCDVTAIEVDPIRAKRIQENLDRLELKAEVIACDAAKTNVWFKGDKFDSILLDAPCTASGIVRRHPDIVFSRRPQDIGALALQQKKLLNALWPLLNVGGRMLYVVCSVFGEEGTEQMAGFLRDHPEARLTALAEGLPEMLTMVPSEKEQELGSIIPGTHDGFFYAMLTKTSL